MMGVWLPNPAVTDEQIAFLRPELTEHGLENALTLMSLPTKFQGPQKPIDDDVYIITVFMPNKAGHALLLD